MNNIHKTAIIEDGAILGDNITIGAFTIIGKNVKIGDGTIIDSHTLIDGKTTIGKNNHIFSHASIGTIPQDLKFNGEDVELIMEIIIKLENILYLIQELSVEEV